MAIVLTPGLRCFAVALGWLLLSLPAHALEPAYLAEWPGVEQVLEDHRGTNEQDTMARQMAALHHLHRSIEELAGPRRWQGLTADEERLRGEYWTAAERIRDVVNATLSNEAPSGLRGLFSESPLREWYALQWSYERDPAVRAATLGRYLTPPVIAQLAQATAAADERGAEAARELLDGLNALNGVTEEERSLPWVPVGIGMALLVLAVVGVRRRRAQATPEKNVGVAARYQEAAQVVVESLEPYLAAAKAGSDPLPTHVLMKPYVMGFLFAYCEAALNGLDSRMKVDKGARAAMLQQIIVNPRFARHFAGPAEQPVLPRNTLKEEALKGRLVAHHVLLTWAGRYQENSRGISSMIAVAASSGVRGMQAPDAAATRLHPDGAASAKGREALMDLFIGHLRIFGANPAMHAIP